MEVKRETDVDNIQNSNCPLSLSTSTIACKRSVSFASGLYPCELITIRFTEDLGEWDTMFHTPDGIIKRLEEC